MQRGGQPIYYYALIQLPVYEFAAIAGTILALVIAVKKRRFWTVPGEMLSAEPPQNLSSTVTVAVEMSAGTIVNVAVCVPFRGGNRSTVTVAVPTSTLFEYVSV